MSKLDSLTIEQLEHIKAALWREANDRGISNKVFTILAHRNGEVEWDNETTTEHDGEFVQVIRDYPNDPSRGGGNPRYRVLSDDLEVYNDRTQAFFPGSWIDIVEARVHAIAQAKREAESAARAEEKRKLVNSLRALELLYMDEALDDMVASLLKRETTYDD